MEWKNRDCDLKTFAFGKQRSMRRKKKEKEADMT